MENSKSLSLFGFKLIDQAAREGIHAHSAVLPKVGGASEVPPPPNGNGTPAATFVHS